MAPPGKKNAASLLAPVEERGATRSGARFAARNVPYYTSVRELLSHHQQLLAPGPVVATRYAAVGSSRGTLLQTTVRFSSENRQIREGLRSVFAGLFRQTSERPGEGFEVIVSFNAILSDSSSTSFSVFYGHDYGSRRATAGGVHGDLRYGSSFLVTSPDDVEELPTTFDFERLSQAHRFSFQNSEVRVARFINIVYLVYQYSDGNAGAASRKRQQQQQQQHRRRRCRQSKEPALERGKR